MIMSSPFTMFLDVSLFLLIFIYFIYLFFSFPCPFFLKEGNGTLGGLCVYHRLPLGVHRVGGFFFFMVGWEDKFPREGQCQLGYVFCFFLWLS